MQSVTGLAGGERQHLTILFCDLVGSVTLTSQVDTEIPKSGVRR
jgi:hypothetical protein